MSAPIQFPTDFLNLSQKSELDREFFFEIPDHLLQKIDGFVRQENAQRMDFLGSSLQYLLARYSGQTEFFVPFVLAQPEGQSSRWDVRIRESDTVRERCRQFRAQQSANPLRESALLVEVVPDGLALSFKGALLETICIQYSSLVFRRETVQLFSQHYLRLMDAMLEKIEQPLSRIRFLTESEERQILKDWNSTQREFFGSMHLVALFEEQVKKTPHHVALTFGQDSLTYQEMNERANQLARCLVSRGIGADQLVGVCMDRSLEMLVSIYAILKAGAGYLPIEPSLPEERILAIASEAQLKWLLTLPQWVEKAASLPGIAQVFLMDEILSEAAFEENTDLDLPYSPEHLAYCIFTSGSTGRPKGVMIEHRSICNRLLWMQAEYQMSSDDRVLQKTPFGFDVSVWELFWPLQVGASLVILEPELHRSALDLKKRIQQNQITVLHFVPAMLAVFLDETGAQDCKTIRQVFCSGEALPVNLQEKFFSLFPTAELHNLYGPTEAAVDITYWKCLRGDFRSTVPIGRPVWNSQIYILDSELRPVPRVSVGEIYLGGVQLARGYLGRPDLTRERFIPNPIPGEPSPRLYKTGDLGRWAHDGVIEYFGRNDFQVKIAGLRIELGEIEAVLSGIEGVHQAVVHVVQSPSGVQQLAAYWVESKSGNNEALDARIQERARKALPSYMVPQHWIKMDEFPLSVSGKVDRKRLPGVY